VSFCDRCDLGIGAYTGRFRQACGPVDYHGQLISFASALSGAHAKLVVQRLFRNPLCTLWNCAPLVPVTGGAEITVPLIPTFFVASYADFVEFAS